MNKAYALLAGLLAGLVTGPSLSDPAATDDESAADFQIMTEQEVERHRRRMAELSGAAREDYRDAEYDKLKERAERRGYGLPDRAPWQTSVAAELTDEPETAPGSTGGGIRPVADTAEAPPEEPPARSDPAETYRAIMKQRFERYLSERAERRSELDERRDRALAEQRERMEHREEAMEARRADQAQRMERRSAEARARSREAKLERLRAEAGALPGQTPVESSAELEDFAPPREQVRAKLERLRAANAAEREKLRDQSPEQLEEKRVELEALRRSQSGGGRMPGGEVTARAASRTEEEASAAQIEGGLDGEGPPQARIEQRRAQVEAQRQALQPMPQSGAAGSVEEGRPEETESAPTKQSSRAPSRPGAPAPGYYRRPPYPYYPVTPYPARPYYPNPYWQPPR